MVMLSALWLPILLSTVFVFIAANILWMALPFWHHKDYGRIADSDAIVDKLLDTPTGQYMLPSLDWGSMNAEQREAVQKRPGGLLLLRNPMQFNMGLALGSFFIYNLIVMVLIAYISSLALPFGSAYARVFRVAATAGFIAYCFNTISDSIWYGKPWVATLRFMIDGILYGLLIGGTFGWLWPR
jgi:hypothetical protein